MTGEKSNTNLIIGLGVIIVLVILYSIFFNHPSNAPANSNHGTQSGGNLGVTSSGSGSSNSSGGGIGNSYLTAI